MRGKRKRALKAEATKLLGRAPEAANWRKSMVLTKEGLVPNPNYQQQLTKDEFRAYKNAYKKTKDVGKR